MDEYSNDASEILEKASHGRISKVQLKILELLFQSERDWIVQKSIIETLKQDKILSEDMKPEVARVQVQKALHALDEKLNDYLSRNDSHYECIKIERRYGTGVRLVASRKTEGQLKGSCINLPPELAKLAQGYKILVGESIDEAIQRNLENIITGDHRFLTLMKSMKLLVPERYSRLGGEYLDKLLNNEIYSR